MCELVVVGSTCCNMLLMPLFECVCYHVHMLLAHTEHIVRKTVACYIQRAKLGVMDEGSKCWQHTELMARRI